MRVDLISLLIIATVAVIAPIVAELPLRRRLPAVVIEIGLGIAVGPQGLGLTTAQGALDFLGVLGLAFLFFLSGLEIDFGRIRGRPLQLASIGWGVSLGLAAAIAALLHMTGFLHATLLVTLALCTTSLGILMPILRDSDEARSRFGAMVLAVATVGEFGPIVLMSLLLSGDTSRVAHVALLGVFAAVAIAAAVIAVRYQPPAAVRFLSRTMGISSQLPVRISLLLLIALVALAQKLGLDVILGSFAAGMLVGLSTKGHADVALREKLDGIGFGFLVPIFFITSGIHFDLHALTASPTTIARLPVFLLLFLLVRGTPAFLFYRADLPRRDIARLALLSSTGLPLIVAIAEIGLSTGRMLPENAAALVGAGMTSVFLFPFAALLMRQPVAERAPLHSEPRSN